MKKFLPVVLFFGILAVVFISSMSRATNCGGNSAALANTRAIAIAAYCFSMEVHGGSKTILAEELFKNDVYWPNVPYRWGASSYWVRKETNWGDEEPFVICGQLFSNVPRRSWRNLYRGNSGYAAAYLDGNTKILNPSELEAIDFDSYLLIEESEWNEL